MEQLNQLQRVGEEMVEVADALLHCRQQQNRKGLLDNVHAIAQLLLDYKHLNRVTHKALDDARQSVLAAKNRCDAQHLRLQNLLYEQAYLTREIQRCRDFEAPEVASISQEIGEPLTTEQYSEQLPLQHTHALEALSTEMQARKSMQDEMDTVRKRRDNILQSIEEKSKFLNELPSQLLSIEQAITPLQTHFQIDVLAQTTRDTAAQALPFPLYTLYKQLEGYKEAYGINTITTEIVQSRTLVPSEAAENAAKRQRTEADTSAESQGPWAPANLALQVKISVSVRCLLQKSVQVKDAEAQLLFQYIPAMNVVVVEVTSHTLAPSMPFTASPLMLRIFPGDTGAHLPNPAALFSTSNVDVREFPAAASARPFLWAQWICGLRAFPDAPENSESYLRVKSVSAVISRLRSRLATLVRLHHQIDLLDKKTSPLPIHPAVQHLLPEAAVAEVSIKSWGAQDITEAQDSFAFPSDAAFEQKDDGEQPVMMVNRTAAERASCVYYKIGLFRQRPTVVNLKVILEIPPDYPLRPPLFLLQSKTGPIDNHLKLVEAQLNADWQQFLAIPSSKGYATMMAASGNDSAGPEVEQDVSLLLDMLLSHQIQALKVLFSAFAASVNGELEAMSSLSMHPPRRGRNRHRASASLLLYSRFPQEAHT